jgi:hypothetical protein
VQLRSYSEEKVAAPVYKAENTAVDFRHAGHMAPSILKKLVLTSPTSGGRSVGIVRSRTQATEFSLVVWLSKDRTEWQAVVLATLNSRVQVPRDSLLSDLSYVLHVLKPEAHSESHQ